MHQKKDNKIVPFDYMKNGSHHKKSKLFCSFLNVFLERTSFVLFALPNASEKDKKIVPFDYNEEWLSPQKEQIILFLS